MSDENVLLAPSQVSEKDHRIIFSIQRKPRTRKPAKSGPPAPETQNPHKPTAEEYFEHHRQDDDHESGLMQHLVETARGVALILYSTRDEIDDTLAWSLGTALRKAVEPVDAFYFGSLGELNEAIRDEYLEVLLKRKLKAVRAKIAENRKSR